MSAQRSPARSMSSSFLASTSSAAVSMKASVVYSIAFSWSPRAS